MDFFRAIEISAAGLLAEKGRVDAAAANLANMNSTRAPGEPGYRPVTAVIRSTPLSFSSLVDGREDAGRLALPRANILAQAGPAVRTVYDPGHPHADAAGMVSYPAVNHTQEMLTVVAALRSYEANLAAIQASRMLAAKALEIGAA